MSHAKTDRVVRSQSCSFLPAASIARLSDKRKRSLVKHVERAHCSVGVTGNEIEWHATAPKICISFSA